MQGLLVAFMNPPADEEAFNTWYDEEHVPLRLAVPGFLTGRRYRAPDDPAVGADTAHRTASDASHPRYLALYDLASVDVLATEAYLRLPREPSPREADMLARIPFVDRRVCELILDCPEWTADPPYQLIVCMTPADGGDQDFVAWYREEHIRLLLEVPGWRRVRLFREVEGSGPAFMAVHEIEHLNAFSAPEYQTAIGTDWRQRIRNSVTRYERSLFALWR